MSARERSAWLFGTAPDLLFGAGLLYLVIMSGLVAGGSAALESFPRPALAWLVLLVSGSHYGATLLRVYEHESERRVYRAFTVYGTIAIGLLLVAGLRSALIGSLLITVYLTWSPWHYTGQNYGISMMFLRRRGVPVSEAAKRALHLSFYLSFASVFLNFHFQGGVSQGDPLGYSSAASSGYHFVSLGLPAVLRSWLMPAVGAAYLGAIGTAAVLLLRASDWRSLLPTALLVLTQAVWFSVPHMGFYFDLGRVIPAFDPRSGRVFQFYFFWTAMGHAVQYLWITAYYARSDSRWRGHTRYLSKAFILGNAVWAAPVVLFAPGRIGGPDYETGLAMCVAAAVNIHHFVLDGAIWKLRNPKIASVLLRRREQAVAGRPDATPAFGWRTRLVWSLAALFCVAKVVPYIEIDARLPAALRRLDFEGAGSILDRAALYGRDSSHWRTVLANDLVRRRRPEESIRHYRRSLELRPDAFGYAELGRLLEKLHGADDAIDTWRKGLARYPRDFDLNRLMGARLLADGRLEEALPHLETAHASRPDDASVHHALDTARRRLAL
jgi:tetratricopeptide (TPR) repeat protein